MRGKVFCTLALLLILHPFALWAKGAVLQDCPECPKMVVLPASPSLGHWAMAQTEITFDQWQACVNAHACKGNQDDHGWGRGTRPIINITLDDAQSYVAWLSHKSGKAYGLPSEDLWDYAAHAGTTTDYPWGNDVGKNRANCRGCGSKWSGESSAPVASFAPNPFGLYDMNGNVWEWTSDCWVPNPVKASSPCSSHVIRGGAWYYFAPMAKSSARARFDTKQWSYTLGLRVVRSVKTGEGF